MTVSHTPCEIKISDVVMYRPLVSIGVRVGSPVVVVDIDSDGTAQVLTQDGHVVETVAYHLRKILGD